MGFDFGNTETWDVSTSTMLGVGNHVCVLKSVDCTGTSSGGYPQVELVAENPTGSIADWIVISSEKTFGKVKALILAAEVAEGDYPEPGVGFKVEDGRLSQAYADKHLVGKRVGVVVGEEADMKDPTKMRRRVRGYVIASTLGSDVTPPSNGGGSGFDFGGPGAAPTSEAQRKDESIPF